MAEDVFSDDFIREKVVTQKELADPTDEAVARLERWPTRRQAARPDPAGRDAQD